MKSSKHRSELLKMESTINDTSVRAVVSLEFTVLLAISSVPSWIHIAIFRLFSHKHPVTNLLYQMRLFACV